MLIFCVQAEQLYQGDTGMVSTGSTDNNLSLRKEAMPCWGRQDHIFADYLVMKWPALCWEENQSSKESCAGLWKYNFASPAFEHLRDLQSWLRWEIWLSVGLYLLCREKFYGSANRKRFKITALDQNCFSRSCFFLPLSGSRCWNIQQNCFSLFFFFDTLSFTQSICRKEIPVFSPTANHPIATLSINWEKSSICSFSIFWFF